RFRKPPLYPAELRGRTRDPSNRRRRAFQAPPGAPVPALAFAGLPLALAMRQSRPGATGVRMEAYLVEWANLLVRWLHLIAGIAWIGASFHFIGLDLSLERPKQERDRAKGVMGEQWAVHGGGFYHKQKYLLAPPALPERLHWFKWEAYTTWLSGM